MYLQSDRGSERFWTALLRDLRSSGSVYGMALDGLIARKGVVPINEFGVISGATASPVKKQLTTATVLSRLTESGLIDQLSTVDGNLAVIKPHALALPDPRGVKARDLVEKIILDALREWTRNIGAASYNQIAIRGEEKLIPVQQFQFDLAGPSYLLPLRGSLRGEPGFLVADVFSEGILDEFHVRYFIRKSRALHATMKRGSILPILVADGFTGAALTAGHGAGVLLATPATLFGKRVASSLRSLLNVLNNSAAHASSEDSSRIVNLVNSLAEIEGRSQNLRGPLFELLAAYLARRDAVSIDMGVRATDPITREKADIDVLKVSALGEEFVAIECKARAPGGTVDADSVQRWLKKTKVMHSHIKQNKDREAEVKFEIWTTGGFTPDALTLLEQERKLRTKHPIDWKTGEDLVRLASAKKERAIADVLREHFIKHPLEMIIIAPSSSPIS